MEPLKHELMRLGLAQRQPPAARGTPLPAQDGPARADSKQHRAKAHPRAGAVDAGNDASASQRRESCAGVVEERVSRMGELVLDVLEETAAMIEKKQARTYDEIERDLALQQRRRTCQRRTRMGRRRRTSPSTIRSTCRSDGTASRSRTGYTSSTASTLSSSVRSAATTRTGAHARTSAISRSGGMRTAWCLGIPNTKHFHGITLIEDAYTLWAKLKTEQNTASFNAEFDEEFEDRSGNVMNRKTSLDLARQGLLDWRARDPIVWPAMMPLCADPRAARFEWRKVDAWSTLSCGRCSDVLSCQHSCEASRLCQLPWTLHEATVELAGARVLWLRS